MECYRMVLLTCVAIVFQFINCIQVSTPSMEFTRKQVSDMVSEHYQDLPYPAFTINQLWSEVRYFRGQPHKEERDTYPQVELQKLRHELYRANKAYNNIRILVAGGGTGGVTMHFGSELRNTNSEIVYLDFSRTSKEITEKRAAIRNLKNVKFFLDKIENIPNLNIGKFDLVQTSGVLHHMENPQLGLNTLANSLNQDGGVALMVYGRYGRTGLYLLQDIMKIVSENVFDRETELENLWKVLKSLNPMIPIYADRNFPEFFNSNVTRVSELVNIDPDLPRPRELDNEFYDRYCHKQDRSYSYPELLDFAATAHLHLVGSSSGEHKVHLDPLQIKNQEFRDLLQTLDPDTRRSVMELTVGSVTKHEVYLSKQPNAQASMDDLNLHMMWGLGDSMEFLDEAVKEAESIDDDRVAELLVTNPAEPITVWVRITRFTKFFLREVIKSSNHKLGLTPSLATILQTMRLTGLAITEDEFKREAELFAEDFRKIDLFDLVYLG